MNTAPGTERKKGADDKKNIVSEYVYSFPSTPELMYDLYYSFYYMKSVNRFMGTKGIVISSDTKLSGGELVQYFFKLHGEEIDPVQAESFSFIFDVMTLVFIDNEEGMPKIEIEQGDPALNERVSRLFTNNDFWLIIKDMFDYFRLIEPYLIEESKRIPYPETLSGLNDIILDKLNSLIFAFDNYTDNELEPLLNKCKSKKLESNSNGETIDYDNLFEYVYFKIKDIQELIAPQYNGAYLWKRNIIPESKRDHIPRMTQTDLPNVTTSILPQIICPLDKVNENIWCGNFQIGEPFMLNAVSERDAKKGKTADIIAMIDFEEMEKIFEFSRPLTVYDKRVWTVVANYAYAGQNIITPSQIYKTAFNERTKPNSTDKEKIVESLKLLIRVRLTLDNTTEAKLYGYDLIKGDYPLLSGSLVTAYVNGQLTESALQISEVPKLFQFALNRNHVATVTTSIYQSPVNGNETGLKISDYLLGRILRMNNPNSKSQNTIVLKTLYEKCSVTNRLQKSRCKTRAIRVLEDFKKKDLIVGFTLAPDETKLLITPKLNNKT
jgi:hypothetical protein